MTDRIVKLTLIFLMLTSLFVSPMQEMPVKGADLPKNFHTIQPRQITQSEAEWLDPAWNYRVPIEVVNPCGGALTDYQVQLTLDSSFNFGHASADGSDVRLTTDDGLTLIPYWIESWDVIGESASIWVKIPGIPASGTTVYVYYGNASPPAVPTVEVPPTGPWEKSANNPIIPSGDPGSGANLLAENIVYDDTTEHYWITFAMYRGDPEVGLAWSDDPGDASAWIWHGSVITDANSPHLIESGGTWHLFYEDLSGTAPYSISVATAAAIDGTYVYHSTVLTPTETWEADGVSEPYVFQRTDGKWIMLYKGQAGSTERVGYAEADDLLGPYTKYGSNPAINLGPSGYYDAGLVAGPWATEFDGEYYVGYSASENITAALQTAYATTTDWLTFTRRGIVLPTTPPGEWDATNAFRGAITRFGDMYYLSYTGGSYQMGIATQPALKAINDPGLVFEFHDLFTGSDLTTQWQMDEQASGGSFIVGGDVITLTAQSSGISGTLQIWGNPLVADSSILEAYARHLDAGANPGPTETNSAATLGYKTITDHNLMQLTDFPNLQFYTIEAASNGTGSGTVATTLPFDTGWHTYRVFRSAAITGTVQFQVDDSALQTLGQPNVPTAGLRPWLMSFARNPVATSRLVIDWVRVRQWCGAELVASVGPEEAVLDLEISKSDSPDPVFIGQTLTYTVVVTNTGIMTATSVVLTDTLPAEVDLAATTPSQGTCSGTATIVCNLGTLAHNAPVTVTMVVTPTIDGTLVNFAEVQTPLTEPETANNITSETTTVEPYADLSVSLTDDPDPVFAGDLLSYEILVSNAGPSTAISVTLTETLPPTVMLVSATPSQGSCAGTSPVVCDLASISNGGSITVDVLVTPTIDGLLTNQVEVATSIHDPEDANNSAIETTTVDPAADISISITDDPDPVYVGDTLTYLVTVDNAGPSAATSVILTNTLPSSVTFVSATPSQGSCAGTDPVVCNLSGVSNGNSANVEIQVTPLMAGEISLGAETSSGVYDPVTANNTGMESTTVNPAADLTISMTDDPDPVYAGAPLTYTITVNNAGPSTAISVTLTDTLPSNTTLVSATPSQGSCTGTTLVTCDLLDILESGEVTVDLLLTPTTEGSITNQAEVTSSIHDPNTSNNDASESTTVMPSADLMISKVDSPDPIFVDNDLTYTITVQNAGPSTAIGVEVTDILPTEVSYVSATPSQGSCAGTNTVVCSLNNLVDGAEATIVIVVTTNQVSTILNEASVSSSTFDLYLENNETAETTIVADAIIDLQINGSDVPDPVIAGETLTYQFDIVNQGPSNATGVVFTDTLSVATSFISSQASQGTCTDLVCDLGDIPLGSSASVTMTVSVASSATGTITNTAVVLGFEPDQNSSDNLAVVETSVDPQADLLITKTDEPDPVLAGELLTYTLNIQNQGPSDAISLTVTDTLPTEVVFVSSNPAAPTCELVGGAVACNLDALPAGDSTQITLVVLVDSSFAGASLTNSAQVIAVTFDPNSSNNTTTAATSVERSADLEIFVTDDPDPVDAGELLTYNLTILNHGPSDAANLELVDDLPPNDVIFVSVIPGSPDCSNLSNVVLCDFDSLSASGSIEVSIVVSVSLDTVGAITNEANVAADTPDPVSANNFASEDTLVLPPDTQPPVVTWLSPVGHNERYDVQGEVVTLAVNATDDVGVAWVHFYRWDAVNEEFVDIAFVYTPPYEWDFDTSVLNPGWNQVMVKAYDAAGNASERRWIWLYLLPSQSNIYLPVLMR